MSSVIIHKRGRGFDDEESSENHLQVTHLSLGKTAGFKSFPNMIIIIIIAASFSSGNKPFFWGEKPVNVFVFL